MPPLVYFSDRLAAQLPSHAAALSNESESLHEILKSGVILCEYERYPPQKLQNFEVPHRLSASGLPRMN